MKDQPVPDQTIFENRIDAISPLSPTGRTALLQAWKEWSVPKDHFLVRENSIADQLFYIKKGVARIYYFKGEKEITEWLALDHEFFFSIISFFNQSPSKLMVQTLEPATLMSISYPKLIELCDQFHDIERWFRKAITGSLILSQQRMESLQFETAQQRYQHLLTSNPTIIQRVPLSYIASFLGITQETLSRIRAQI